MNRLLVSTQGRPSGRELVRRIREAHLPEILTDRNLAHLLGGSPARCHNLVKRALAKQDLVQIRRGLYVLSEVFRKQPLHPFALSQWIYGPSYISFESSLSYWGLIPEAVYSITCGTSFRKKHFSTPVGEFSYFRLPVTPLFHEVERVEEAHASFLMAKPLRALVDYVYVSKRPWTYAQLSEFLRLEDLTIQPNEIHSLRNLFKNRRVQAFLDSCVEAKHDH